MTNGGTMEHSNEELTDHDMLIRLHEAVCGDAGLVDRVGKQNGRIGKLEQRFWMLAGGIVVIGFALELLK